MTTWKNAAAILAAMTMTASAQAQTDLGNPRISDIKVHLLYEQSGELSKDITTDPDFIGRNVIIGEGSAMENANDLIVMAVIDADEEVYTPAVLSIKVTAGEEGAEVARRYIDELLLDKKTHRAILIEDAGCMGDITIEAKIGFTVRTETISLQCGE